MYFGFQPKVVCSLVESATSSAGSSGAPRSDVNGIFLPTMSSTARITSFTELPLPVPALNFAEGPPLSRRLDGGDQGLRQIGHMDIVAHAGPVGCRVILAENGDRLIGLDRPEEKRNKVCLRFVLLAQTGAWFGPQALK